MILDHFPPNLEYLFVHGNAFINKHEGWRKQISDRLQCLLEIDDVEIVRDDSVEDLNTTYQTEDLQRSLRAEKTEYRALPSKILAITRKIQLARDKELKNLLIKTKELKSRASRSYLDD